MEITMLKRILAVTILMAFASLTAVASDREDDANDHDDLAAGPRAVRRYCTHWIFSLYGRAFKRCYGVRAPGSLAD